MPLVVLQWLLAAETPPSPAVERTETPSRTEEADNQNLNLLGKTDAQSGEAKRNDNVSFDLVDNNALKEQNARMGTSAALIRELLPKSSYFGAEFGNSPSPVLHVGAAALLRRWHGALREKHQNSILNARRFFQVGSVQPAHENEYSADLSLPVAEKLFVSLGGLQQKVRGSVNGKVLAPLPTERVPLTNDPAVRALLQRWLRAYPGTPPNRTDIDERALITNAPQSINTDHANGRIDSPINDRNRLSFGHSWRVQQVRAFEFVAGQNPWTTTKNHSSRLTFSRMWSRHVMADYTLGFDRTRSVLTPEPNAVGPAVEIGTTFTKLGPGSNVPLDRVQNRYRAGATFRHTAGPIRPTLKSGASNTGVTRTLTPAA